MANLYPAKLRCITPQQYPRLYESVRIIAQDNGLCSCEDACGDGWEVLVPDDGTLARIEASLAPLSHDDLETLCIGEETDMLALVERRALHEAHDFLVVFFDGLA